MTVRPHLALAALALAACNPEQPDHKERPPNTGPSTETEPCTAVTVTAFPAVNATDVPLDTLVEFDLGDHPDPEATIVLDAGGELVDGTVTVEGSLVTFQPDASLLPDTAYNATLAWTCGPTTSTFRTQEGHGTVDPASLIGRTYALDLASGRWIEPPGVGGVIGAVLTQDLLVGVTDADATVLSLMGALSDDQGGQDTCVETIDFPIDADFTQNPYFAAGAPEVVFEVMGLQLAISDLDLSGGFDTDGSKIAGAAVFGILDVGTLAPLVGSDPCALFATFGVSCVTCANGNPTCVNVAVDSMQAPEVAGLTLVEVTAPMIAADPACY